MILSIEPVEIFHQFMFLRWKKWSMSVHLLKP